MLLITMNYVAYIIYTQYFQMTHALFDVDVLCLFPLLFYGGIISRPLALTRLVSGKNDATWKRKLFKAIYNH